MTFVSYAQNYEDVMLWRALKHIENGFYIDVGAAWPDEHSVTKAFYDQGWHGINVEPNPIHIDRYIKERVNDINLPVALSDVAGETGIYFISNTGLSSINQEIAESHGKLGWVTNPSVVNVKTLASICEEYCLDKDIHFLKIDIEGFEKQALQGNNWEKFRPWIIVVESTLPMTQTENYGEWESILLDANYLFAYADGLNRFYISEEHAELLTAFKYPPNVFDEFKLIATEQAEAKAEQAEAKAEQAEAKAEQAEAKAERSNQALQSVYNSRSWIITRPLRKFSQFMRWLSKILTNLMIWIVYLPRRVTRWILVKGIAFLSNRPVLRIGIRQWLTKHPYIYNKLRLLAFSREVKPKKSEEHHMIQKDLSKVAGIQTLIQGSKTTEQKNIQMKLIRSANIWKLGDRIDT